MVSAFDMAASPAIRFGVGVRQAIPLLARSFGERLVLVTGKRSFVASPFWPELQTELEALGISWRHHIVSGEPSPATVDQMVEALRDWQPQLVLAIGGGSVLDAGKALAAMLTEPLGLKNYLEGVGTHKPSGSTLPMIAVPTTAGTGSEATKNAVLSEVGTRGFKKSLRHDRFIPRVAIVDPALYLSTPPDITAQSGMDAFTQLLESYVSTKANPMTDALALDGMRGIKNGLLVAWENGENLGARSSMAYAALLSGITLANAGLGVVHGFASSVGGRIEVPHGLLCGSLMGITNRLTLPHLQAHSPALYKYAKAGRLFHPQVNGKSDRWYAEALISTIEEWTERFRFPGLSQFGLTESLIPEIVKATGQKNHPVSLSEEEMGRILMERM
jgi:alcohol dehydrogenase class IV